MTASSREAGVHADRSESLLPAQIDCYSPPDPLPMAAAAWNR